MHHQCRWRLVVKIFFFSKIYWEFRIFLKIVFFWLIESNRYRTWHHINTVEVAIKLLFIHQQSNWTLWFIVKMKTFLVSILILIQEFKKEKIKILFFFNSNSLLQLLLLRCRPLKMVAIGQNIMVHRIVENMFMHQFNIIMMVNIIQM